MCGGAGMFHGVQFFPKMRNFLLLYVLFCFNSTGEKKCQDVYYGLYGKGLSAFREELPPKQQSPRTGRGLAFS